MRALGLAFSQALTQALSAACDAEWTASLATQALEHGRGDGPLTSFRFRFQGTLEGECFLCIRNEDVVKLPLKGIAESSRGFGEEHATVLEQAFQSCLQSVPGLLPEFGATTLEVERAHDPELSAEHTLVLRAVGAATNTSLGLQMYLDAKLVNSLLAGSARAVSYAAAAGADSSANLDLVLDVALNVTLRFGQRQLALREVLDLTSGSVVELDRQVDEPVELVLDGRVVARGEAVIIDGNYGMRITQVVQPIVA
jgi:flagellar motor switch protein FliN/FliY